MGSLSKLGREYPREYTSWQGARNRCNNPNNKRYEDYGGRGIKMCKRWQSFEMFIHDMGPKPGLEYSLDRIDNDGPYSPENCKWSTQKEQRLNKYNTQRIEHPETGEVKTLGEWADQAGLTYSCLHIRLTREGLDLVTALSRPIRRKGPTKNDYKEWCERFAEMIDNHLKTNDPYSAIKLAQERDKYYEWLEDVDG